MIEFKEFNKFSYVYRQWGLASLQSSFMWKPVRTDSDVQVLLVPYIIEIKQKMNVVSAEE